MTKTKRCSESLTHFTQIVLPNDTNAFNNLRGGQILHWMDIAAAISSQKHSNHLCVTASVDNVSFTTPIKLGWVVTIRCYVTRSFRTSMEIFVEVWAENVPEEKKYKSNEAYYTFVALDDFGRPTGVPEVIPETEEEKMRYAGALRRRQLRLVLGGRMKPHEATELKALFIQ